MSVFCETLFWMVLGTQVWRLTPFLVFRSPKRLPLFDFLGNALPPAIMFLLVIYCLKDTSWSHYPFGIPEILGVTAVASLHFWRRNGLLSIFGGSFIYLVVLRLFSAWA